MPSAISTGSGGTRNAAPTPDCEAVSGHGVQSAAGGMQQGTGDDSDASNRTAASRDRSQLELRPLRLAIRE